jgi:hypothetical protein
MVRAETPTAATINIQKISEEMPLRHSPQNLVQNHVNGQSPETQANPPIQLQANHGLQLIQNGYASLTTRGNARSPTTNVPLSTIHHATNSKQTTASAETNVCSLIGIPKQEHLPSLSRISSSRSHKEVPLLPLPPSRQPRRRTTARIQSPIHRDAGGVPATSNAAARTSPSLALVP